MTTIKKIIMTAAADGLAAGQAMAFIRLGGNAVLGGEQTIVFGGEDSATVQSGSDAAPSLGSLFMIDDADIAVRPVDTISIAGEFAGADVGDMAFAVTLVYGK